MKEWNRSAYNSKEQAIAALEDLMAHSKSKYIMLSYNNEGIISQNIFNDILNKYGKVKLLEYDYNTYRGSRNLKNRDIKVKELIWIVKI